MTNEIVEDSEFETVELEYIMARVRAMKEAKRKLEKEIKSDMDYIKKAMGDKTEMKHGSFMAKVVIRTRKGVMSLAKVTEILGEEMADKVTNRSVSEWIQIEEVFDMVEPFTIGPEDLVPEWTRTAYDNLTKKDEEE